MSDLFNEIMPETDSRVLCIKVTKPISQEGFTKNLIPRLDAMVEQHDEIRLLVYYADYHGWEEGAVAEDMTHMVRLGPKFRKTALVAPPKKEIFKSKISQPLIKGEIRFFDAADLAEAIAWIKL